MGLLSGIFGGGKPQTTSTRPYDEQMPYIQDIFRRGQTLSNQNTPYYPGETFARSNPLHDLGFGGQMGIAQRYGGMTGLAGQNVFNLAGMAGMDASRRTPTVDPTQRLTQQLTGQIDLDPYNQVADAMRRQTMDAVNAQVGENDQLAAMMGQSGSSRHGVAEGILRKGAQDSLTDSLANMYLGAYEGGQNRATQGVNQAIDLYGKSALTDSQRLNTAANLYGMVPQFGSSQLGFAGVPLQAGDFYRNEQQRMIDDSMARYNYDVEQPWSNLERYADLVYGSPGGSRSTATAPSNSAGQALGGAMTGIGLAGELTKGGLPALGFGGALPWGIGGAILGGLL